MRNLKLNNMCCSKINHPIKILKTLSSGDDNNEVYILDSNLNVVIFRDFEIVKEVHLGNDSNNTVIEMLYDSFRKELVCGFQGGELFSVDCITCNVNEKVNIYPGIRALQFSPDEELLVVVTSDYQVILLTSITAELNRCSLLDSQFGEGEFINVGWGKKETQFHGSEGKQAAKQKIADVLVESENETNEKVEISWRGDGQLFAVSYCVSKKRLLKIFDKEGILQYTSEYQPGVEPNLCWRPSGNVIACTQQLPNKYVVAFFEKNGLKHGDFVLPEGIKVKKMIWSYDSEILAVLCDSLINRLQSVLLYSSGNYHWYLKQHLQFENDNVIDFFWDGSLNVADSKKLHVVLDNGEYLTYKWTWHITQSKGCDEFDNSVVAVIDGQKVLLTNFRQSVVPPPMSALEIQITECLNDVVFAPGNLIDYQIDSNSFCAVTDSRLLFYKLEEKVPLKYDLFGVLKLPKSRFPLSNYSWYWLKPLLFLSIFEENGNHYVKEYHLVHADQEYIIENTTITKISQFSCINGRTNPKNTEELILQLENGKLISYSVGGKLKELEHSFSVPCYTFDVVSICNNLYFIGLSLKNRLFLNSEEYAKNISSMFIHSHFLILTSLQHQLIIVDLTAEGLSYLKNDSSTNSDGVYKRNIERGAKLVTAVPWDTRTILQMPRGNLECIQPRPLSLKIIGEYLNASKYVEAFDLMRKQRINLNLFHDHNPALFMDNIYKFVDNINNNAWLNLFIASLEDVDVTTSMYASSYVGRMQKNEEKVSNICKALEEVLSSETNFKNRKLPLITTFLKQGNVEGIEKALSIVKSLKQNEANAIKESLSAEEALKYIFYMVDVNTVFDIALGMYDFDLVLSVASKSQKDPKEYIQMLNDFKGMEENYMKFSINKYLKRYEKAVQYLAQCRPPRDSELRTFVKYHGLFKVAMKHIEIDSEIHSQVAEDYALHLKLNKHYYEAGVIYRRGGHIDKAIDCFKEIDWELALRLATKWPIDHYRQLCRELVERLSSEKDHTAVLFILEKHLEDITSGIEYAIKCSYYSTALRLCNSKGDSGENVDAEKLILQAIKEDFENTKNTITSNGETFMKYRNRLVLVREYKARLLEADNYDNFDQDCDLYSDAASTIASNSSKGSKSSNRSFRSSKNRRKHERKLISLKEGSRYEDIALMTALHNLVVSTFEMRMQVKRLCQAMCWFELDEDAHTLQASLESVLRVMPKYFDEIWTSDNKIDVETPELANLSKQEVLNLKYAPIIHNVKWKLEF